MEFAGDNGCRVVVVCQWEPVSERDVERITALKKGLPSTEGAKTRLIVIARSIDSTVQQTLDRGGISWREVPMKQLRRFLDEQGAGDLAELFAVKSP